MAHQSLTGRTGGDPPTSGDDAKTTFRPGKPRMDDVRAQLPPGKSLNALLIDLVDDWVAMRKGHKHDEAAAQRDQHQRSLRELRTTIVRAISRQLELDSRWIEEAVLDFDLYRQGSSAFGSRLSHYRDKGVIADEFIPLLVQRALRYAETQPVVWVIDSGTSTFRAFERLASELGAYAHQNRKMVEKFSILTNNVPGVTGFMTISQNYKYPDGGPGAFKELADLVPCHVVGGKLRSRYGALLGPSAVATLAGARESYPGAHFIGLLSGQFVRIDDRDPHAPVAMARTPDQIAFKKALCACCDETYVVSPMSKLFVNKDAADINRGLVAHLNKEKELGDYLDVDLGEKAPVVKLVSTYRPSKQLLFTHSERLKAVLGRHAVLGVPEDTARQHFIADEPEKLPSILMPFDDLRELSEAEQTELEFPHEDTRQPGFLKEFFSV